MTVGCTTVSVRARWIGLVLLAALTAGCGQGTDAGRTGQGEPQPDVALKVAPATVEGRAEPAPVAVVRVDPRLHQSFAEATISDPPGEQTRPPDVTTAGTPTAKLYKAVVGDGGKGGLWEQVKFVTDDGRPLQYTATVQTAAGNITIELRHDAAPNHVRNFIALARAGYYDGLRFDRAVQEAVANEPGQSLQYLEAGSPRPVEDLDFPYSGSIGWWMKPEIAEGLKHEAGTVGAWHGEEVETAACKFYITMDRAPWIDGQFTIFGKITGGLDVARKIYSGPRQPEAPDRPLDPVVIERVTITATPAESVVRKTS